MQRKATIFVRQKEEMTAKIIQKELRDMGWKTEIILMNKEALPNMQGPPDVFEWRIFLR